MTVAVFAFIGSFLGSIVGAYIFAPNEKFDEDFTYKSSGHHGTEN